MLGLAIMNPESLLSKSNTIGLGNDSAAQVLPAPGTPIIPRRIGGVAIMLEDLAVGGIYIVILVGLVVLAFVLFLFRSVVVCYHSIENYHRQSYLVRLPIY